MNLAQLLVRASRVHPARDALMLGAQPLFSYAALAARVARLAGHLRHGLGLAPGDRVALCLGNGESYLEVLYAAWWAGLVVVPINARLHPAEVGFILQDSACALLVADEALGASLLAPTRGADPARPLLVPGVMTVTVRRETGSFVSRYLWVLAVAVLEHSGPAVGKSSCGWDLCAERLAVCTGRELAWDRGIRAARIYSWTGHLRKRGGLPAGAVSRAGVARRSGPLTLRRRADACIWLWGAACRSPQPYRRIVLLECCPTHRGT